MTTEEKIQLRNKARRDFEGKEYKGEVINQVLIAELKVSNTVLIQLFDLEGKSIFDFRGYGEGLPLWEGPGGSWGA